LTLFDTIGFDWFDTIDFKKTSFTNGKGEKIEVKPLAEYILNYHSKKILTLSDSNLTEERINKFIDIVKVQIEKNPGYEWIPYYKVKLLTKVNRKKEALTAMIDFARNKSNEYWIWDRI